VGAVKERKGGLHSVAQGLGAPAATAKGHGGDRSRALVPSPLHPTPKIGSVPMPNIPGGLAVSVVGIINGAINGIAPQVLLLRSLGVPV